MAESARCAVPPPWTGGRPRRRRGRAGPRRQAPADREIFEIFERIREEHARTVARILEVTGDVGLMAPWPALGRAAERRNPAIDVLSHLLIALLARSRTGPPEERERARQALLLTVKGIAAGLQTVG